MIRPPQELPFRGYTTPKDFIFRLFIDSGKGHPGFAGYIGAAFVGCWERAPEGDWPEGETYYELPSYNRHRATNPNSLIICAAAGALAAGRAAGPEGKVEAIDVAWKGNVPKHVVHKRMLARLSSAERAILKRCLAGVAKSKQHDLLDAVCMGEDFLLGKGIRT